MATKIEKIAEIVIDGKQIDIDGEVCQEAFVFVTHYNEEKTQKIINQIKAKEIFIIRKLERRGYFFNDEISNVSVETEVIVYLLKKIFEKRIGFGQRLGQQGQAIYYDEDYVRRDGKNLAGMIEDLYNEHYRIGQGR